MTALFIAAFTEGWVRGKNRVPAILGLTITLACRLVFGQEIFLIPAMLIITMALIILRPKLEVTYE
jgi:4-azaleucine resistance transporter AzlC